MRTQTAVPTCSSLIHGRLSPAIEERQALLEIESGRHAFEGESELHHRQRHLRLNADDDGLCAAQLRGVRDAAERASRERVEHVERGYIDDHTARAMAAHQVGKVVTEL